jgi:uncharacterized membrane protein (Fun14 family)
MAERRSSGARTRLRSNTWRKAVADLSKELVAHTLGQILLCVALGGILGAGAGYASGGVRGAIIGLVVGMIAGFLFWLKFV